MCILQATRRHARRLQRLQAHRLDRGPRLRDDPPRRLRALRHRPGEVDRASRSAWASSASRCSATASPTSASSSRTTRASWRSSDDESDEGLVPLASRARPRPPRRSAGGRAALHRRGPRGRGASTEYGAGADVVRPRVGRLRRARIRRRAGSGSSPSIAAAARKRSCAARPTCPSPGGVVVLAPLGAHLPAKNLTIARRDIGGVDERGHALQRGRARPLRRQRRHHRASRRRSPSRARSSPTRSPKTHDTIFEIGLTPNRPDGLGHVGLAREAGGALRLRRGPSRSPRRRVRTGDGPSASRVRVTHRGRASAARTTARRIVDDVTIGPSPRRRAATASPRSASARSPTSSTSPTSCCSSTATRCTPSTRTRSAAARSSCGAPKDGEKLVTLDGVERTLVADDLVIADAEGPIALAGVMGGASERDLARRPSASLLECAYFDPRSVRRTARRHGLHSESSHRFERGVDHGDTRARPASTPRP